MIKQELTDSVVDVLLSFFRNNELSSVIIYGSYAEGRETQYSDIDVLIILDKELSNWREKRQIEVSLRKATISIGHLSPRVMTEKEFASAFKNYDPFVLNVLLNGQILYTSTFKKARSWFENGENRNIVRTQEGYWEIGV